MVENAPEMHGGALTVPGNMFYMWNISSAKHG